MFTNPDNTYPHFSFNFGLDGAKLDATAFNEHSNSMELYDDSTEEMPLQKLEKFRKNFPDKLFLQEKIAMLKALDIVVQKLIEDIDGCLAEFERRPQAKSDLSLELFRISSILETTKNPFSHQVDQWQTAENPFSHQVDQWQTAENPFGHQVDQWQTAENPFNINTDNTQFTKAVSYSDAEHLKTTQHSVNVEGDSWQLTENPFISKVEDLDTGENPFSFEAVQLEPTENYCLPTSEAANKTKNPVSREVELFTKMKNSSGSEEQESLFKELKAQISFKISSLLVYLTIDLNNCLSVKPATALTDAIKKFDVNKHLKQFGKNLGLQILYRLLLIKSPTAELSTSEKAVLFKAKQQQDSSLHDSAWQLICIYKKLDLVRQCSKQKPDWKCESESLKNATYILIRFSNLAASDLLSFENNATIWSVFTEFLHYIVVELTSSMKINKDFWQSKLRSFALDPNNTQASNANLVKEINQIKFNFTCFNELCQVCVGIINKLISNYDKAVKENHPMIKKQQVVECYNTAKQQKKYLTNRAYVSNAIQKSLDKIDFIPKALISPIK